MKEFNRNFNCHLQLINSIQAKQEKHLGPAFWFMLCLTGALDFRQKKYGISLVDPKGWVNF